MEPDPGGGRKPKHQKTVPVQKKIFCRSCVKGILGVWSLIRWVGANQSIKKRFPFKNKFLSLMLADNKANQSIKKRFPFKKRSCVVHGGKGILGVWSLIRGVGANQSIKKRLPFKKRVSVVHAG